MADSSLPPLTPPGGTPPLSPIPPVAPLGAGESIPVPPSDAASSLSPFKVLGKQAPMRPPSPQFGAPVPPAGTSTWVKVDQGPRFGVPVAPPGPKVVYGSLPPTDAQPAEAPGRLIPTNSRIPQPTSVTPPPPPSHPAPTMATPLSGAVPPPPPAPPTPPSATPVPPPPPLPVAPVPPTPPTAPTPPSPPTAPTPPTPPAAPKGDSGSPMDEDLNEADLVARAAEAHGDPLILPDRRIIADSKPAPTEAPRKLEQFKPVDEHKVKQSLDKIEVKSRGEDHDLLIPKDKVVEPIITKQVIAPAAPPPPPSPFGAGAPPPPPLPTGRPLQPGKMAPPPPPPPMGKPFGAPKPLPTKPVPAKLPPVPLAGAPHKTSASLLAGIGLLVAILVLGGGGYVLALTGTRLPLFGTMVSGLPGNVVQATNAGTAFVDAHAPYRFTGASDITLADEKSKTLADGTPAVFKLHTEYKGGLITDKGARFLNSATVSANDGAAVPISLRDTGNEYLAAFPANTDTTPATLVDTNLDDTLLAPSLHPIPVEVVLKAVQTERSYQKVVIGQKPAGSYNVTLDPAQLKDYFPTGSTVENPLAIVALAWKGAGVSAGQPLDVQVSTSFTYMERKYQFTAHWVYDGWGETTAAPAELGTLAATDPGNVNTDLTSESFVSRLGIAFKALPHGTSATSGAPTDDTTRFTPVIPSGDVIEVVQTARAENPPVPSQPATTEGKQRDAQRKQDLQDIQKALEQYKLEKGSYPTSGGETQLGTDPTLFGDLVPNYLTKMPVDPLNSTYYYAYNVITDSSGNVTGYYLRAVLEDHSDPSATVGQVYHYYQLTNK